MSSTKATEKDLLLFEGVLGAVGKGVPLEEAVELITAAPGQWNPMVDRVLESFGQLEVEA